MKFPAVDVLCTAAHNRAAKDVELGINPLNGYRRAVGSYLVHQISDFTGIEAHRHHSIPTNLMGCKAQPLHGLKSTIGQQFGVTLHLAAEHRAETGTDIGEGITGANSDAEDFTMHRRNAVARKVVRRHHNDRRAVVNSRNTAHLTRILLRDRRLNLVGPGLPVPPAQLGRVLRIGVPACGWVSPCVVSHNSIVRPGIRR